VRQPEVERLPAARRQAGDGAVFPVRMNGVAGLDRRDNVLQQILLEGGERGSGSEEISLCVFIPNFLRLSATIELLNENRP
jgi:hypothetical protein